MAFTSRPPSAVGTRASSRGTSEHMRVGEDGVAMLDRFFHFLDHVGVTNFVGTLVDKMSATKRSPYPQKEKEK